MANLKFDKEITALLVTIADLSEEKMRAALEINIPNYASTIVTTDEVVDMISSLETTGISV